MRKYPTTIAFTIMMMVMILLTGCATDTISVGVRDTPTPELVEGPVRVVPGGPACGCYPAAFRHSCPGSDAI